MSGGGIGSIISGGVAVANAAGSSDAASGAANTQSAADAQAAQLYQQYAQYGINELNNQYGTAAGNLNQYYGQAQNYLAGAQQSSNADLRQS